MSALEKVWDKQFVYNLLRSVPVSVLPLPPASPISSSVTSVRGAKVPIIAANIKENQLLIRIADSTRS